MSTLNDDILQQQIEDPDAGHPCYSANAEASTLMVEASNRENWLLPWQHFLDGRQQTVDGSERLVLTFATQEIVVVGKNLEVLIDEIARRRLEGVRPVPDKYQKSSGTGAFVAKIEVRLRTQTDAGQ